MRDFKISQTVMNYEILINAFLQCLIRNLTCMPARSHYYGIHMLMPCFLQLPEQVGIRNAEPQGTSGDQCANRLSTRKCFLLLQRFSLGGGGAGEAAHGDLQYRADYRLLII